MTTTVATTDHMVPWLGDEALLEASRRWDRFEPAYRWWTSHQASTEPTQELEIWDDPTSTQTSFEHLLSNVVIDAAIKRLFSGYGKYAVPNWDGDDANPITDETLGIATKLLKQVVPRAGLPDAAPGADGSIGLEWWNGSARVFIDIGPGRKIRTYLNLGDGRSPEEELVQWGAAGLELHLSRLFSELHPELATSYGGWSITSANTSLVKCSYEAVSLQHLGIFGFVFSPSNRTSLRRPAAFIIAR